MACCTHAHVFIHGTIVDWKFISAYSFVYFTYLYHYHHQHNHLELINKSYIKSELKFKTAYQNHFINNLYKIFQMYFVMLRGVARPLRMGPISCPNTSANRYQSTEGTRSQNIEDLNYTAEEDWNMVKLITSTQCLSPNLKIRHNFSQP